MCIVSKVQSIKLFAPCGTLKVMESFDNRFTSEVDFKKYTLYRYNRVDTYNLMLT
jgi:hypothetical protein